MNNKENNYVKPDIRHNSQKKIESFEMEQFIVSYNMI